MMNFTLSLPFTDPVLIFFIVLAIILFAPILLNKIRIPHIIGMIIAGIIVGENGIGLLLRDSSFEIFGNVGLLYLMFLAGLEMDVNDFMKNKRRGIAFGIYTFAVPMLLGTLSSHYLLGMSWTSSILLASMYASHTLVAYPLLSRYGVARSKAVTITIAGTIVTVFGALIVLAVITGTAEGVINTLFWIKLFVSIALYCAFVLLVYPRLTRWFLKKYDDNVSQYIFVLALVFAASFLARVAGLEPILGAFLAGVVLTRFIPTVSPLMNRIEFVGNALFIPYFLIGIGMLIDVRLLFTNSAAMLVALNMSIVATLSKWIAAWLTQKSFKLSKIDRTMIFGLSNGQAAATLAAVLIGYRLGLFDDDVLNGTIVMILVTCTISSIVTEQGARQLASEMKKGSALPQPSINKSEGMLIPVANPATIEMLVNMALTMRSPKHETPIYALYISDGSRPDNKERYYAEEALRTASQVASAADVAIETISRYDINIATGIINSIKERNISEVVIGLHHKANIVDTFFGAKTMSLINGTHKMVSIARCFIPVNTTTHIVVAVPEKAEYETGFAQWVDRLANMAKQIGCRIIFHAHSETMVQIRALIYQGKYNIRHEYELFERWEELVLLSSKLREDDLFVIICARRTSMSYNTELEGLPLLLARYFASNNLLVMYPEQFGDESNVRFFSDPMSVDLTKQKITYSWLRSLFSRKQK